MAKKGQKFNKYNSSQKLMIVQEYLDGKEGYTSLSKKYYIPKKTIETWIYQYKHKNNDLMGHQNLRGRKKEESIDYKERYEILKEYQTFLKAQRERK